MSKNHVNRTVSVVFGVFFVVLAMVILLVAWEATPIGALIAALGVGLLGADAIVSAVRDRPSLLSRIGPLP